MSDQIDIFSLPEWKAIHRESVLINQIIGSGVTSLGRANYADGFGEYYSAFFGLSIGMERLAKLTLIADFACANAGELPRQKEIRKFGHDISKLMDEVEAIAIKHNLNLSFQRPVNPICKSIVDCLNSFANASVGRYANFESIGNPSFDQRNEPVNKWWVEVAEPILDTHYRSQKKELDTQKKAEFIASVMEEHSVMLHFNENHNVISDFRLGSERTGQTKWIQIYGRYYTLQIVRWMADVFHSLTFKGTYDLKIECLFGHSEIFRSYTIEDKYLKSRKIWPLE